MSSYTSIILFISPGENLSKRMEEVNGYKMEDGRAFSMMDVNGKPYPDVFPRFMLCGAYNHFNLEHFLTYLRSNVFWEEPQNVRLIIQDDLSENVDYYSL